MICQKKGGFLDWCSSLFVEIAVYFICIYVQACVFVFALDCDGNIAKILSL